MKKIILATIFLIIVFYLSIAFIKAEINIFNLSETYRIIFVIGSTIIGYLIISYEMICGFKK